MVFCFTLGDVAHCGLQRWFRFMPNFILLATLLLHTEGTPIPLVETREVDSSAAGKLPKVSSLADLSRARSISKGLLLKRAD